MDDQSKTVPAGEFKQGCLALLDEVARSHIEIVVTKRGVPVAKLVPIESAAERDAAILARLRGRARLLVSEEAFVKPTVADAGWNLQDDDP